MLLDNDNKEYIIKHILNKVININIKCTNGTDLIFYAILFKCEWLIEYLCLKDVKMNSIYYFDEQIPLYKHLFEYGTNEIIKRCINYGIDLKYIDRESNTAIHYAIEKIKSCDIIYDIITKVEINILHIKNIHKYGIIHTAVSNTNYTHLIRYLTEIEVDYMSRTDTNETPLLIACRLNSTINNINIIKLLIEKGGMDNLNNEEKIIVNNIINSIK